MSVDEIVAELRAHANPANVAGMARFGINPRNTLGLSIPFLRKLAKPRIRALRIRQVEGDAFSNNVSLLGIL